ncbi:hypothetical protein FRC07_002240 [Ceratobasidium sp. 392]|nr:hypothetical protein FRC07_002240 [Ceratobasidium sp. 392]
MIFSLMSLISFIVFFLPLTALAAPAAPTFELESRANVTHNVTVGGYYHGNHDLKLRYSPQYVHAKPGDIVRFEFHQVNHTATESTFTHPCSARPNGTWDTGYVYVPKNQTTDWPTYDYHVTDKKPHWFYCRQDRHCRRGMVFAINPPKKGKMTFKKFQEKAMHGK